MGIGIIFIGVVAYIVVQAVVRSSGSERKNRQYGNRDRSADNYFFPGADPNMFTGDSRSNDQANHRHNDGNSGGGGHHGHHNHSHGGSRWDSGHHGGHGGWDSGGHGGHGGGDSGGGDSGGGGD